MGKTPREPQAEVPSGTANDDTRRAFVKTVGKAAIAAPAVALLLNASTKPAKAELVYAVPTDV